MDEKITKFTPKLTKEQKEEYEKLDKEFNGQEKINIGEEVKVKSKLQKGDKYFHGLQSFMKRKYWIDEVHNIDEIIGQYCFFVQVPEVNHDPMIFTISIREYDNGYNQDDLDIKRPAIFDNEYTCREFMNELYFPDKRLLLMHIDREIALHKLFKEFGAYSVRKPLIDLL